MKRWILKKPYIWLRIALLLLMFIITLLAFSFHLMWNFSQGSILGFAVSGSDNSSLLELTLSKNGYLTGGGFGFEGSILCTIMCAIIIYILISKMQQIYLQ